jgi:hypothetical protein
VAPREPAPPPAAIVSGERWLAIVDAAKPHSPSERARNELERSLSSYPGLRRDTSNLRPAQKRWDEIHKHADKLYALLTEEWQQGRLRYVPMVDDVFTKYLLRHSRPFSKSLSSRVTARKGRRDPDREWLYLELLDIWINSFHGRLAASSGATGGPCVRFVRTAISFVLPPNEVPRVGTVREIVQQLGRGKWLGVYRYDRVVGAKRSWR